jgi:hypothetical protein
MDYQQLRTEVGPPSELLVTQLSVAFGPWNRPGNCQLTELEGNLSHVIDVAIGSL